MSWSLSFVHMLREGNECADWLAKFGAASDDPLHLWPRCLGQLALVLLEDALGRIRLRVWLCFSVFLLFLCSFI